MTRLIVAIAATVLIVGFAVANTHHVDLSLVFGAPVQVRLIFLLASTFSLGALTGILVRLIAEVRKERRARMARTAEDT